MSALDIKLLRDFRRLWAQVLAIALVLAAGVMTLVLSVGTERALSETQRVYYDRYRFADLFASASRAPNEVLDRIAALSGVAAVEGRIAQQTLLDIEGMAEPASGQLLSLPETGEPRLNALFVKSGRLPEAGAGNEIAVSGAFAEAHGFVPGDTLSAIIGGQKRALTIAGIVLSPEFVYSVGAGDLMPDNKRFGILFMRYPDLAAAYDLNGAFNALTVALTRGANAADILDAIDDALRPYGGQGAYTRETQTSHAFLEAELQGLRAMIFILPPIFLGVAAFLVNMTLARLVALEREQIGLLKALGYPTGAIAWHYIKLALAIALVGILVGWGLGALAGRGMAAVYAEFYKFPFLYFQERPDVFILSGAAAFVATTLGAFQAVRATVALPAAVAMAPPAPPRYKRFWLERLGLTRHVPQGLTMALRSMARRPVRAVLTVLGIALSTALLVGGLFSEDSMDYMLDATYFRADRQTASLNFFVPVGPSGLSDVARLPGVLNVEPYRAIAVIYRHGAREKRGGLTGRPLDADLSRVIDPALNPVPLPEKGLALSKALADILGARVGDMIEVEIIDGRGETLSLPLAQIIQQFVGLGGYMALPELNRVLGESLKANGANLLLDRNQTDALYAAVKQAPNVIGVGLQRKSLEMFRQTLGENLGISRTVFVVLAVIIVFGVVYNSMHIQLSERARELASLRVLGFTRGEASFILMAELAILTAIAIPAGFIIGYGMAYGMAEGMASELYRLPLIIDRSTYANAALVVLAATIISALIVRRRIDRLDMVAVLKTRD